jgi:spore coat protein U-like protein
MTRLALRLALSLAVLGAVAAAAPASAQTTFEVSATVVMNCVIDSADAIDLGDYDPVVANASTAATQQGDITVRCTKGTPYTVALEPGLHASGTRRMQHESDATEYLAYELYTDSGYGTVWTTAATVARTSTSRAPFAHTVYARALGGQDVKEGRYGDTVTATIDF